MPTSRRSDGLAWLAVGGVVLFWLAGLLAGALAPGYSARTDYLSSLAGRGSEVAPLGIANLAVLGATHLVAAVAVRRTSRATAALLALAGLAGLTVASFRISCPGGASGCGFDPGVTTDVADRVHAMAVLGYEVALLAAMVVTAAQLARSHRLPALASAVAAVASVVLLAQIGGADNGWWQRAWLVVNTSWLVWLVLAVRSRDRQLVR
jgi:hypothetical protein